MNDPDFQNQGREPEETSNPEARGKAEDTSGQNSQIGATDDTMSVAPSGAKADTGPDPSGARAQGAELQPGGSEGEKEKARMSRRAALVTGGLIGVGSFGLGMGVRSAMGERDRHDDIQLQKSYPLYGQAHQAGIATPPQSYSMYMTFKFLKGVTTRQLQVLLARWTAAIAQMQKGMPVGTIQPESDVTPPGDTGEAYGLSPASLTVTVGLGPKIFGPDFGLHKKKPELFEELPRLNGDVTLQPALTGGDLSVQACADDPQVAYHAVRNLARIGRAVVTTHWTVLGFGRASAGAGQETPRNLLGFKDGTRNVTSPEQFRDFVWIDSDDQPWLRGGAYQVVRKIKMLIETWDTDRIGDQQLIIGRSKHDGAPLTGQHEHDTPNFAATNGDGKSVIDPNAHIALVAYENNDGKRILRRSYNYTEGVDSEGNLDAGLLFIAYMKDPQQFTTLQNRLGATDLLNEYIRHIGSAIFVVPPAPEKGSYLAKDLFA